MKIKTDDTVIVISGKDRGKTGKVKRVLPKEDRVTVEGVNMVTRHIKPRGPQEPGGIKKLEAPTHVSNVMYYDVKSKKGVRVGYQIEDGKKARIMRPAGTKTDK